MFSYRTLYELSWENQRKAVTYKASCDVTVWEILRTVNLYVNRTSRKKERRSKDLYFFFSNNHQMMWSNSRWEYQFLFSLLKVNRWPGVSQIFFFFGWLELHIWLPSYCIFLSSLRLGVSVAIWHLSPVECEQRCKALCSSLVNKTFTHTLPCPFLAAIWLESHSPRTTLSWPHL